MHRGRPDANKNEIARYLRDAGLGVKDVSVYPGFGCDLILACGATVVMVEIKSSESAELTESERLLKLWCREHGVRYEIIRSVREASLVFGLPYQNTLT